jgi:hypothetical protein
MPHIVFIQSLLEKGKSKGESKGIPKTLIPSSRMQNLMGGEKLKGRPNWDQIAHL